MRCPCLNELPRPPAGKQGWPWTMESGRAPETAPQGGAWPRISIVTPSYNQGRYIEGTIRSVLLQGYPDLEYIVIDGGSTDRTKEVIKKYEPWISYWVSEKDRGQSHAINKGLARATGKLFSWLNSDDLLLPDALSSLARAVLGDPQAVAWVGACRRVDPDGNLLSVVAPRGLSESELPDWAKNFFYQPACFARTDAVRAQGGISEDFHFTMCFELWLRLLKEGRFAKVEKELAQALIHPEAKTQAERPLMMADIVMAQCKNGYEKQARRFVAELARHNAQLSIKVDRLITSRPYRLLRPLLKFFRLA